MRQVNQAITNAVTLSTSTKSTARLTAYKSRTYFDVNSPTYNDFHPDFAHSIGAGGLPSSSAVSYIESINKVVTVSIDDNGHIALLREETSVYIVPTIYDIEIEVDPRSRPGIFGTKIFYYSNNEYSAGWYCAEFDEEILFTGGDYGEGDAECILSNTLFSTLPSGAIYPVSATEAIILYIDEGAVRPVFIASDFSEHECPGRFINPVHILDDTNDIDFYTLHYAGAILKGETVYTYFTTHYGSVKVVKYKIANDGLGGTWSDQLIAVPEDLSTFKIGNVILEGDRIFICGSFYRNEEYNTGVNNTLLSWSDDGINFSLDRRTLVTQIDLRFLVVICDDYVMYISANRYNKELSPYQINGENCPNTIITLNSINGGTRSGWYANAKASNEVYVDNTNIDVGYFAKLEIGIETINGIEWVKYHDVVISSVKSGWKDGERTFNLQIIPDGLWHISSMTHPFYMEVQGKQSHFDPMVDLHNLYKANSGSGPTWSLSVDLWTADYSSGGMQWQTHDGGVSTDHLSRDLAELCNEYPVFEDASTYVVKIYGWSRAGVPSTNPNTADSTPTNTNNDDFYALLLCEDEDGEEQTVVSLLSEKTSTYIHPNQTWFTENIRTGSNPVTYAIANPGEGWKIKKLGVRVISGGTTPNKTTYYVSRIEMPGITTDLVLLSTETSVTEQIAAQRTPYLHTIYGDSEWPWDPNDYADPCIYSQGPHGQLFFSGTPTQAIGGDFIPTTGKVKVTGTFSGIGILHYYEDHFPPYNRTNWITLHHHRSNGTLVESAGDSFISTQGAAYSASLTHVFENVMTGDYFEAYMDSGLSQASYWDQNKIWTIRTSIYEVDQLPEVDAELPVIMAAMKNTRKGIPQIFFSSRPYSAWNFDATMRTVYRGPYALSGIIGLATDKKNMIVGYIRNGHYGIMKVRNGVRTVLHEDTDANIVEYIEYDIRFWHRNGLFGLEYKEKTDPWPTRGSQLTYEWTSFDEEVTIADDIFHMGIYQLIDPPRFRTTGFRTSQINIPVLPLDLDPQDGDSDFATDFPSSGVVDIDGKKFTYTGKLTFSSAVDFPIGPIQLRNFYKWNSPFNKDPDGSYTYPGGKAIEFTEFRWLAGATGHDDYEGALIGSNAGYSWINGETQWKSWITTYGAMVYLRERSRHYSSVIPDYVAMTSEKIYITNGLTGITPPAPEPGQTDTLYPEGTFVYLDSDDSVTVNGFFASNGEHDNSIAVLLDKFCRIAGTKAVFDGDITPNDQTLNISTPLELS